MPRCAATVLIAVVIAVNANWADALVFRLLPARDNEVDERVLIAVPRVEVPLDVPSLVKTVSARGTRAPVLNVPKAVVLAAAPSATVTDCPLVAPEVDMDKSAAVVVGVDEDIPVKFAAVAATPLTVPLIVQEPAVPPVVPAEPVPRVPMSVANWAAVAAVPATYVAVAPLPSVIAKPEATTVDEVTATVLVVGRYAATLPLNTFVPLKFVVEPIWLISFMIDVNSVFAAVLCEVVRPPLAASVAIDTAWLSSVVTCERAPSAVCRRPTPLEAFWLDWVRAAMLAPNPLAIERPAGSFAPELILNPVDSCWSVFCRLV